MMTLTQVLQFAHQHRASDVRLSPHHPPWLRVKGTWRPLVGEPLTAKTIIAWVFSVLSASQAQQLRQTTAWPLAFGVEVPVVGRLRLVLYHHRAGMSAVFRLVSPPLDPAVCALPSMVWEQLDAPGLVLLQGGKSSGRSTLASAFVHYLAQQGNHHIITLESPVEACHQAMGQPSRDQQLDTEPACLTVPSGQTADHYPPTQQHLTEHAESQDSQPMDAASVATTAHHTNGYAKRSPLVEQHDALDPHDAITLLQTLPRAAFDAVYVDQITHYHVLAALMNCVAAGMTVIATSVGRSMEQGLQQLIDLFPPAERHRASRQLADCLTLLLHQTLRYPSSLSDAQRQQRQHTSGPHNSAPHQDEQCHCLCYQYLVLDNANRALLSAGDFDQLTGIKHGEII